MTAPFPPGYKVPEPPPHPLAPQSTAVTQAPHSNCLRPGEVQVPKPYDPNRNRIVCSALRYPDGFVVASIRHMDPIDHQFLARFPDYSEVKYEQGFIDRNFNYHDRRSAWKIAFDAGQILRRCGRDDHNGGELYSENLY